MLLNKTQIKSILNFWFPNDNFNKFWFNKSVDNKIYEEYYTLLNEIYKKLIEIDDSNSEKLEEIEYEELLALIILLDQFSRNINRLVPINLVNFTTEARKLSNICINKNYILDKKMSHICFILMPLRHLNKINDYYIIIELLDHVKDNQNEIFYKFKNETMQKLDLLKN
jgi:uncharacterized protein (DUF924 family)